MDEDAEELVTCPYNTCHRISKKRLPAHLYKSELVYHHQHCPSRKKLESFIYLEEGNATNRYPVHNIGVETGENWDDSNVPTYDAEKYCMHHGVLRKLDVAPPSKKKEFQRQERERLKVVESPICDLVERSVPDENLEREKVARVAKPTTDKQVQEGTNETHISHEIDKPATKEDRSAVLKDLIKRGLKTPFTPKK
ncbi:unnamed protein product [Callosobruchus maculatus]|uniref:CHHC U11-48K-type domain-containing protein n=1 Tax=Callosobruchus maculatus TaxID=64391 RepID=A0A653D8T6_CALMS|nr:unnamed protein product [Callosobruchus maculatus]